MLDRIFIAFFLTGLIVSCSSSEEDEQAETVDIESVDVDTTAVVDYLAVEEDLFAPIDMPRFDVENNGCLPTPHERFFNWKDSDSIWWICPSAPDEIYIYLMTHLDSMEEKQITETDPDWGPLEWHQEFENGIVYHHHYTPEKGSSGGMVTKCADRDEFMNVFFSIIETDDNVWNEDSTEYVPDGAGCWYSFKKDSNGNMISDWSCGC